MNYISILCSFFLVVYVLCFYVGIRNTLKEKPKKKDYNKIIFKWNEKLYQYKDQQTFYKSLDRIEEVKFFIKSINEKDRITEFIQTYYPDAKIYRVEL